MRKSLVVSLLLTIGLVFVAPGSAQDASQEVLALKPEVQTAAWAASWWMPRHKEKLEELKGREKVDLVMIGDSITHGWENRGREVWDKYYAKRNAFNLGFSGDRTENVLWRLQHGAVDGIAPKLVVIMIGTNNTGHRQDKADETAAGVQAIVDLVREKLPAAKILLLAIFPRGATSEDALRKLNEQINRRLAKLDDEQHVFFLNINETFLDDEGNLPKSVMPDLLHPNPGGYEMWAAAMEPSIQRLMGETD